MFDLLTDKLGDVFRSIRGRGRITEDNVREAMRRIRTALLEADVHMQVVRDFSDRGAAPAARGARAPRRAARGRAA